MIVVAVLEIGEIKAFLTKWTGFTLYSAEGIEEKSYMETEFWGI